MPISFRQGPDSIIPTPAFPRRGGRGLFASSLTLSPLWGEGLYVILAPVGLPRPRTPATGSDGTSPTGGVVLLNERDEVIYDFQGNAIRLPRERWLHIMDPSGDHPYMVDMWKELVETLENPEVIVRSTRFPYTSRIYHRWFDNTPVGGKWVRVVTNFPASGDAFVLTAYSEDQVIAGEVLWQKEDR